MVRLSPQRGSTWRTSVGRIAAAVLAIGALSAMVIAPTAAGAATNATTATEIATAKNAKLGTILVSGTTVYTLKPSKTKCTAQVPEGLAAGAVARGVTAATAGTGVDDSKLGTVAAAGGLQVTYGGKPLYWFAKDKAAGQVHGNVTDKWGKWSRVSRRRRGRLRRLEQDERGHRRDVVLVPTSATRDTAMSSVVVAPTRPRAPEAVERGGREASRLRSARARRARRTCPRCSIAAAAVILIGVGWATGWGGADFAASMTSLRVVVIGPLTLAIIGVFLVVERVRPAQRRPLFARGHRQDSPLHGAERDARRAARDGAHALVRRPSCDTTLPWIVLPRIGTVPRWGAIAVIFVAMDGCNWFVHLANHRVRMLWRFHELHHSQEDMSVLTVFRTHPLIHVSYLVALIPGIVLLANGAVSTTLLVVYGGYRRVRALEHQPRVRAARSGSSSAPTTTASTTSSTGRRTSTSASRSTIWDQLFRRAVFPTEGDDQDRHRAARDGRSSSSRRRPRPRHLLGLRRAARRPRSVRCTSAPTCPPVRSACRARRRPWPTTLSTRWPRW